MEDVQTSWGILPRWKARALALAEIQTVVDSVKADGASVAVVTYNDAAGASALPEEQRAPDLAADAAEPAIPPEVMSAIEQKIDQLTARLDAFERRRAAEEALDALETEIERLDKAALDALDPLAKPRVDDAFAEATALHTPSKRLN
jgi:hypothetical protein